MYNGLSVPHLHRNNQKMSPYSGDMIEIEKRHIA